MKLVKSNGFWLALRYITSDQEIRHVTKMEACHKNEKEREKKKKCKLEKHIEESEDLKHYIFENKVNKIKKNER